MDKTREEVLEHLQVKPLWYPSTLAPLLDVNISTIYRWISEGKVETVRLGPNKTRVRTESLVQFLGSLE